MKYKLTAKTSSDAYNYTVVNIGSLSYEQLKDHVSREWRSSDTEWTIGETGWVDFTTKYYDELLAYVERLEEPTRSANYMKVVPGSFVPNENYQEIPFAITYPNDALLDLGSNGNPNYKTIDELKALVELGKKLEEDRVVEATSKKDVFGIKETPPLLPHIVIDTKNGITIDGVKLNGVQSANVSIDENGLTYVNLSVIAQG